MKEAIFAGGCFWCMEAFFDSVPGVTDVVSGYTGGTKAHPTHFQVKHGETDHVEAVKIAYDPDVISYEKLLDIFWKSIDPTDPGGQFSDRGAMYATAIFYTDKAQKKAALKSRRKLNKSGVFDKPVVTEILEADVFYPADEDHQGFHRKNPYHYRKYKEGSGRDAFLRNTWFKPSKNVLKKTLSPLSYHVTQENGTEMPFDNPYHDNDQEGLYVDIVSGEPLFTTNEQYDAGCGWPSFTSPLGKVKENSDLSHGMRRIEVRSDFADSHLGHVFDDGPKDKGGLRYCINSAALRFIPKEKLEEEGYGEYLIHFDKHR